MFQYCLYSTFRKAGRDVKQMLEIMKQNYLLILTEAVLVSWFVCKIDRCVGDDEAGCSASPCAQKCSMERNEQAVFYSVQRKVAQEP